MHAETRQYARACLDQGMGYASVAQATGVNVATLQDYFPGHQPPTRTTPTVSPASPLSRALTAIQEANPADLSKIAQMALHSLQQADPTMSERICSSFMATVGVTGKDTPKGRLLAIVDEVARRHGLTRTDLLSDNRTEHFAHARQEAYWELRRHETKPTYPQIGRLMGRDHTTVLYGERKHQARLEREAQRLAA